MHIITAVVVKRPYKLMGFDVSAMPVYEHTYDTLEEMAKSASWSSFELARNRQWPETAHAVCQLAFDANDKPLAIDELVAWGTRLRIVAYRSKRYAQYVFRTAPVSGIRKDRGGNAKRNHRLQNERSNTALVVMEDGEVSARASRRGSNLPCSWGGRRRIVQRSWKSQHKGTKSWARPALHGEGNHT